MAFMHSLSAPSDAGLAAVAIPPVRACFCTAADAGVTGANVRDTAIRIAKISRRRCRAESFQKLSYHEGPYETVKTRLDEQESGTIPTQSDLSE